MNELIKELTAAIAKAKHACAMQQPADNKDIGFHFGRLQGTALGLSQALKIVENFLEEAVEPEDNYAE